MIEHHQTLEPKTRVAYIPLHAEGDINHPDVEYGRVSSTNSHTVFVKFDKSVGRLGWDGTTSQGVDPYYLVNIDSPAHP